jgi:hypothetical protein
MPLPEAVIHYGPNSQQVGPLRSVEGDLAELDTCALDYLIPCASFAGWKAAAAAAGFSRGAAVPGFSGLYIRDMSAEEEGDAHALLSVNGHGLLPSAGEKRKRIIAAAGQIIGVGPIERIIVVTTADETGTDPSDDSTVPAKRRIPKVDDDGDVVYKTIVTPTGTAERWNINQAFLTVSDTYFATTLPSTTVIGTAVTPPSAPTPPSYIWGSYGEVMRANHPSGWVLDDRQIEEIVPGSLYRVTDSFGFYYVAQPD